MSNSLRTITLDPLSKLFIKLWRGLVSGDSQRSCADFSRAALSGADLFGVNLFGVDLSDTNLSRAELSGADLFGVNLTGRA